MRVCSRTCALLGQRQKWIGKRKAGHNIGNGSQQQSVMAPSVYDRPRMEILLFLEHGQFAWAYGALNSQAQHFGTRCR